MDAVVFNSIKSMLILLLGFKETNLPIIEIGTVSLNSNHKVQHHLKVKLIIFSGFLFLFPVQICIHKYVHLDLNMHVMHDKLN